MPKGEGSSKRGANWAFLVYPESAPDGWMDIINLEQVDCFISPLHNPDNLEEEDGGTEDIQSHDKCRKPHYHVMLMYGAGRNKSKEQVEIITKKVNGTKPIKIESVSGYAKYLLHLGKRNAHKQQWPAGTMPTIFGDVDYLAMISKDTDVRQHTKDMCKFVDRHNICYLYQLADYCANYNDMWFDTLSCKRTLFMREYIASRRYARIDGELVDSSDLSQLLWEREQEYLESNK